MPSSCRPTGPLTAFIYQPDTLSWIVAFLAGIAGMLSLTSAKSAALVGVLISVTTVPAAANVALALAFGEIAEARGSAIQLGINLLDHRGGLSDPAGAKVRVVTATVAATAHAGRRGSVPARPPLRVVGSGSQRQGGADDVGQAIRDRLGFLLRRGLDHDANERLGPALP